MSTKTLILELRPLITTMSVPAHQTTSTKISILVLRPLTIIRSATVATLMSIPTQALTLT
jgi:hypothetical protein